ncbi:MAG: DUF4286 family protein [Bacteroidota bacterium]
MLIYNVTINIEEAVHQDWLTWMKETHIPDVLKTGCFTDYRLLHLLTPLPETKGPTYAIQYFCESQALLNKYQSLFAPTLQQEHLQRFPNKFVAFRTILEEV